MSRTVVRGRSCSAKPPTAKVSGRRGYQDEIERERARAHPRIQDNSRAAPAEGPEPPGIFSPISAGSG